MHKINKEKNAKQIIEDKHWENQCNVLQILDNEAAEDKKVDMEIKQKALEKEEEVRTKDRRCNTNKMPIEEIEEMIKNLE